jgi:hypothetical protein
MGKNTKPYDHIGSPSGTNAYRDADIRYELTGFVRRKVLRSRVEGGKRLYEVNY